MRARRRVTPRGEGRRAGGSAGRELVVPMPLDSEGSGKAELDRFLHEMSIQHAESVAKLSVTVSSLPSESTVVMLEPRGRST